MNAVLMKIRGNAAWRSQAIAACARPGLFSPHCYDFDCNWSRTLNQLTTSHRRLEFQLRFWEVSAVTRENPTMKAEIYVCFEHFHRDCFSWRMEKFFFEICINFATFECNLDLSWRRGVIGWVSEVMHVFIAISHRSLFINRVYGKTMAFW